MLPALVKGLEDPVKRAMLCGCFVQSNLPIRILDIRISPVILNEAISRPF